MQIRKVKTYEVAALNHVISAFDIFKSLPAKVTETVIEPDKKADMATAIVTEITNSTSCAVE